MNAKSWSILSALLLASVSWAQGEPAGDQGSGGSGPVRLARISFSEGNVSWRPDESAAWSQASPNLPLQQGAQVWVAGGGRAEVQFDDGSTLRLGNDAVITLQSLFSDSQGEFTELKLNDGTSSFHLKDKYSIYQVDTPYDSVKAAGPARFRVDVGDEVRVGVRTGGATLSSNGGDTALRSGDFVALHGADDSVRVRTLPREDSWDRFDDERDGELAGGVEHCPPNIAIVAGGLGRYGDWGEGPHHRWYWFPRVGAGWRPYYHGTWIWVNPFGWTWCSSESWGWAPYHYGAWECLDGRWGWCPGPYHQYWCPAVVHFSNYNGSYCWAPLCPDEVVYPSFLSIGFGSGNWWFNFSIGGCAVYRPGFGGFCEPVAFHRRDFDHRRWDDRFGGSRHFEAGNDHFVPRNSRFGAVSVSERDFGHGNHFRTLGGNGRQYFERGKSVTAASGAFSGPVNAVARGSSLTPSHEFRSGGSPNSLNRSLYRAPVDGRISDSGQPFGRTINRGQRTGSSSRSGSFHPSGSGSSNVDRARQSLGYSGRSGGTSGSSSGSRDGNYRYTDPRGDRVAQGSTSRSRGIERSSGGGASNVERARQSLGYGSRNDSRGGTSSTNDRGSSRSGQTGYTGRYSGSSNSGSSRSDQGGYTGRYSGSSTNDRGSSRSGQSGYTGRSSGTSNSGSSGGSNYRYRGDSQGSYSGRSRGSSSSQSGSRSGAGSGSRGDTGSRGSRGDSGSRGSRGDSGSRSGGSSRGSSGDRGGRGGH